MLKVVVVVSMDCISRWWAIAATGSCSRDISLVRLIGWKSVKMWRSSLRVVCSEATRSVSRTTAAVVRFHFSILFLAVLWYLTVRYNFSALYILFIKPCCFWRNVYIFVINKYTFFCLMISMLKKRSALLIKSKRYSKHCLNAFSYSQNLVGWHI